MGKLSVRGKDEKEVVSIDEAGNILSKGALSAKDVSVSGTLSAEKLNLSADKKQQATVAGILTASQNLEQNGVEIIGIQTNGIAGSASLPKGTTEIALINTNITNNTLIYITPTTPTGGKTLYVKAKNTGAYFIVALESPITQDVGFNWWIVN